MSGWKDIDGSMVMAGSPGHIECLDITFGVLLGDPRAGDSWGLRNLSEVRSIAVTHGHRDLVARCDLAEQLITAARLLFVRTTMQDDPYEACKAAVDEL